VHLRVSVLRIQDDGIKLHMHRSTYLRIIEVFFQLVAKLKTFVVGAMGKSQEDKNRRVELHLACMTFVCFVFCGL
jgi:hypothetical protein